MTPQDCLDILRQIKDVSFATVDENGLPQNRIIDVMIVENEKLYFCTARGKAFYHQLLHNENVAITAMNPQYQMVRFMGKAKKLEDSKEWIDRIIEKNPSMNDVYPGESRYILEPFCVDNGELEFFDLGKKPIYRKYFTIGNDLKTRKGFTITKKCIACGLCKKMCPEQCIKTGTPYIIHQEECLHCGLCYEQCPAKAIITGGIN